MQKIVTFPNDDYGEDNAECELRINQIVDLELFMLRKSLAISESTLLQQELYDSRDPDQEDGGEYLGNEHADIEQFYSYKVRI